MATGHVDFVLAPADIAQELARIGRHPKIARTKAEQPPLVEQESLAKVFLMLRRTTGVDFTNYKRSTIERRILRRMVLHRIERPHQYVKYLQQNPTEVDALFEDMLINVTGFFRDPATFDALKLKVFPRLMQDKVADTPVRMWVPGCSTGEEVYSLAIALLEYQAESGAQIASTDLRH